MKYGGIFPFQFYIVRLKVFVDAARGRFKEFQFYIVRLKASDTCTVIPQKKSFNSI